MTRSLLRSATAGAGLLGALACEDSPPTATQRDATGAPSLSVGAQRDDGALPGFGRQEICGAVASTVMITRNAVLTCDVICTNASGPCIEFGKDDVGLWLNGFTMTGPADPPAGCATSPAFSPGNSGPFPFDGISTAGFDRVRIRGPGMVQAFRRHGIFVRETDRGAVSRVTSHDNCFSGIFVGLSNDNDVTDNVSVRNGAASGASPCGGNCITSSNGNRVRGNQYHGNGSVAPGAPGGLPNDFGVGLIGTSTGNVIEDNSIGGNINGILIAPLAVGNRIHRNVIAGNPPKQVSVTAGSGVGADIRDFSPAGSNRFELNFCITYEGATMPPPCPSLHRFGGHR